MFRMIKRKNKRGQEAGAGSAAVFVAIIALMIILYVLFLPPEERARILGEDKVPAEPFEEEEKEVIEKEEVLLLENPGLLTVRGEDKIHHFIPRVRLFAEASGVVLEEYGAIAVKRSLFDNQPRLLVLGLDDPENTKNVLIDFVVKKGTGDLVVKFNDEEIYEGYIFGGNIEPIKVKDDLLQKTNLIEFSVSSPGLKFWRTNEYYIEKVKAVGTITDVSHLITKNKFYIAEDELRTAKKIELKYYPSCDPKKIGPLVIKINNQDVYSGTPVCNIKNHIEFGSELIHKGDNDIIFSTTKGDYEINRIDLSSEIEKKEDYVYYFDLDEEYFIEIKEERCGDVDGTCPIGCDEDEDIDCCFRASEDNYWCDLETDDIDDRCVSAVDSNKCLRCLTGYEDNYGKPPEACEERCGDDTDDHCPEGCSKYYDKDCCYEESSDNYWCDDVPVTGLASVCEASISSGECDDCPSGYKDEDGYEPGVCEAVELVRERLKKGYRVVLDFKFLDDKKEKKFELSINGRKTIVKTTEDSYSYDISSKVEKNYNSIIIKPEKSLEIREMKVTLKED